MASPRELSEASAKLGFAIGVIETLGRMIKLNERQTMAVEDAAKGLREIDLMKLSGLDEADKE